MSEALHHFVSPTPSTPGLEAAATEFRAKVEDAAGRLNAAAEQFVAMTDGLLAAVEEARQAAERAEQAQRSVEALKERLARDYGDVSELVRTLQERIAALAILGQPMPAVHSSDVEPELPEPQPLHAGTANPGESAW